MGGPTGKPIEDRAEAYLRRAKAAELRRKGHTWDEVAEKAGYSNRSNAYNAVKSLLREHQSLAYEEAGLYRQESLDRLNDLYHAAWPRAEAGSEKHMTICLRIINQIDELTGAKAPVKHQWEESDVDRLLREAVEEHRRRAERDHREAGGAQPDQAADR